MGQERIHIVIGILKNNRGQVLLAKRHSDVHQGGLWEFPGGKMENNETVDTALNREIYEELGTKILQYRPLIKLNYDYPERKVLLDVWLINQWQGEIFGREGQSVEWIYIQDLNGKKFPPANESIVKALQFPSLYLICPGPVSDMNSYLDKIEKLVKTGANIIQLRCRERIFKENPFIIDQISEICSRYDTRLLLNSSPANVLVRKAQGVHLSSARLLQLNERPLDSKYIVAASCHNMNEIIHAGKLGLDFAVLSPVEKTSSHPHAIPLGWEKFESIVENAVIPVYALGGMKSVLLKKSWEHGAQGLAILSGVWQAENPVEVIRQCLIN